MGKSEGYLSCKEFGLVLGEHAHLNQVAEQLTSLDKLHEEVDTELVLEDVFHVDEERMVNLTQDILLKLNVLHLLVLQNDVLSDAFHGVELASCCVLYKEHFAKGALADHLADLEIFQGRWLLLVSGEDSCGATSHGLAHFHAILVGRLRRRTILRGVSRELLASKGLLIGEVLLTRR